jgi:hypothetical protein
MPGSVSKHHTTSAEIQQQEDLKTKRKQGFVQKQFNRNMQKVTGPDQVQQQVEEIQEIKS